ncbi:hypothetical protein H2198_008027 [Neophaeococcomyces mojaviensis]|uniref:Uncharacterized protein n=1 Tax=Neophaeococcomyces mojaviensis TaxID=3383035 RepID=A0ACC2ZYI5_9EURO|nr:hypothetical protein H2198_008027 [Knufia sp. JES_112]
MYWKDNNRSGPATPNHPISTWTPVNIKVTGLQKDSSLGYTDYMIYQAQDTTIRGANVTWGAENTTVAQGNQNGLDTWILQAGSQDIHAIRGTHLSITAIATASKGRAMLAFFQQKGNDVRMYSRDVLNTGGLWSAAAQDPVTPST